MSASTIRSAGVDSAWPTPGGAAGAARDGASSAQCGVPEAKPNRPRVSSLDGYEPAPSASANVARTRSHDDAPRRVDRPRLALGPTEGLTEFASAVGSHSYRGWIAEGLLGDVHPVRAASIEYFDQTFADLVARADGIDFNLTAILANAPRFAQLERVLTTYLEGLQRSFRVASFCNLAQRPTFPTLTDAAPSATELELFIVVSNEALLNRTRFFGRGPSTGTHTELRGEVLMEKLAWMRPLFQRFGAIAGQNHTYAESTDPESGARLITQTWR